MVKRLKRLSAIWLAVIMAVTVVMPIAAAGEYAELYLGVYDGTETIEVGGEYYPYTEHLKVYGNDEQIEIDDTNVKENTQLRNTALKSNIDYIENTGITITGWTLWGGEYMCGFVCEANLGEVGANPTVGDVTALTANKNYSVYMLSPIVEPYAITHHPTSDEPYVLVNNAKTASYRWYVRDLEADLIPVAVTRYGRYLSNTWGGSYDSIDGVWRNGYAEFANTDNGVDVILSNMSEGDIITVTIVEGDVAQINVYEYYEKNIFVPNGDKTVWTCIYDDKHTYVNPIIEAPSGSDFAVTIEVTPGVYSEIRGETGNIVSSLKEGREYYCKVEWWYNSNFLASERSNSFIYDGEDEDGDRRNFWPWLLLLTRAVRYYDGDELLHTARIWKENSLEYVYEPEAKEGYTFEGWYVDEAHTEKFDFAAELHASHRVYAKWVPVSEGTVEE